MMAKNYSTLLIFFFSFLTQMQSQGIDFPTDNAFWKEQMVGLAGVSNRMVGICNDTTINGVDYQQLAGFWLAMGNDSIIGPDGGPPAFIRSEGPVVFAKYENEDEFLLYDFSLALGDSIVVDVWGNPMTFYVDDVAMEMIANKMRKVIYFETTPGITPERWIEGIGSNYGVLQRGSFGIDAVSSLLCFNHQDDYVNFTFIECFFPDVPPECDFVNSVSNPIHANHLMTYPNPVLDVLEIQLNDVTVEDWNMQVYNLLGQLIYSSAYQSQLDVRHWPKGGYVLRLKNKEGQIYISRFVKQ